MILKNKLLFCIYILLWLVCSTIKVNCYQNIIAVCNSILLVVILINRGKIKDDKFKLLYYIIIITNITLIFYGYYNSIKLGYNDGLVHGQVGDFIYNDTWNYYYESKYLHEVWKNGGFKFWMMGNVQSSNLFYGFYNFFIIWNTILRLLFGENLNLFIIIKYQFSILSIYYLYKIARNFLEPKYVRLSVFLMSIFPGYLSCNITLMRDNIIVFFIIYASYIVIINKNNYENMKFNLLVRLLLIIMIITYMRVYIGVILAASLIIYYILGRFNINKIFIILGMMGIGVLLLGTILEKMGYGFLGKALVCNSSSLTRWDPEKISSPIKFIFWVIYYTFLGGRTMGSPKLYIGNVLTYITPIFIIGIIFPVIFIWTIKIKDKKLKYFIIFVFLFSILNASGVFFIFTGIIPRLYSCWIWCQIILFCYMLQQINKYRKNILIKSWYTIYISIMILYVLKI